MRVENKTSAVHRIAYRLWIGEIAEGMEIDHTCRVRDCFNPQHLRMVTVQENRRGIRQYNPPVNPPSFEFSHCPHGHEFTAENTYFVGSNKRYRACRTCSINSAFRSKQKVRMEAAYGKLLST